MEHHYTIDHLDYSEVILKLIKDDLRISKLLNKLSRVGLDTDAYNTQLHDAIFLLIGFKKDQQTEELKDWYFTKGERIFQVRETANLNAEIEVLAAEIYNELARRLALFYPTNED